MASFRSRSNRGQVSDSRVVLEVAPSRSAAGGVASMVVLTERVLTDRGWTVLSVSTVSGGHRFRTAWESVAGVARAFSAVNRNPAVVHLHVSQGGSAWRKGLVAWYAHCRGCRVVSHIHGSHFDSWATARPWRRRWVAALLGRWSSRVIALSGGWAERLEALGAVDIAVVNNAVELPSATSGVGAEVPVIVFAGRLEERKGIFDLLAAISIVQSHGVAARYELAGDGMVTHVAELAARLPWPEEVHVAGWLSVGELRRVLETASMFVLPSYDEGLPVALLEAMGAGLACVATPVGGIPEVVHDGQDGTLVEPGNVVALAAALEALCLDVVTRASMGARAREHIASAFSSDTYGDKLSQVLESLLPGGVG